MDQNRRLKFQKILEELIGSRNVYFEPPPSFRMNYPCIRYKRAKMEVKRAGNKAYSIVEGYELTVIDSNPDSAIPREILSLPYCSFVRHYTAENLNHDVFNIYF